MSFMLQLKNGHEILMGKISRTYALTGNYHPEMTKGRWQEFYRRRVEFEGAGLFLH